MWLLDWATREARVELACPARARRLAWSRDGRQLAVVGNQLEAEVWDMETRQVRRLSGHRDSLFDVAFDPAGERLATASLDGTSRLWDLRDGRLLAVTTDRRLVRWGTEDRSGWSVSRAQLEVRRHAASPADAVRIGVPGQADGKTLDVSPDGNWTLTLGQLRRPADLELGEPGGPEVGPLTGVESLSFHPKEDHLFLTRAGALEECDFTVVTNSGPRVAPSGCVAAAAGSSGARPESGHLVGERRSTRAYVHLNAGAIWVEHLGREHSIVPLEGVLHSSLKPVGSVRGTGTIALSPDGKWLVCGADGHLGTYAFDTGTGRPVAALDDASGGVQFSPDGRWVLLASGDGCRLFRTADWKPVWKLPNDPRTPSYAGVAAIPPDGNQLAYAASTRGARLVETATGRTLAVLEAPAGSPLNGLRWTADGRRLVGATRENTIDVWEPAALRRGLAGLGLDWDLPDSSVSEGPAALPLASGFSPWIAGVIPLTTVAVAVVLLLALRRHRQLIEEFSADRGPGLAA